jgi:hypothetical protein
MSDSLRQTAWYTASLRIRGLASLYGNQGKDERDSDDVERTPLAIIPIVYGHRYLIHR